MKKIIVLILSAIMCGCATKVTEEIDPNAKVVNLPVSTTDNIVQLSDLAESLNFIQLESGADILIGEISKIIPTEDRLILVDIDKTKSIFFFDYSGKFLNKINRTGRAGSEYVRMTDVAIDTQEERVFVLDGATKKIVVYSFEGKFLESFEFPFWGSTIEYVGDNHVAMYCGYSPNHEFEKRGMLPNVFIYDMKSKKSTPYMYYDKRIGMSETLDALLNFTPGADVLLTKELSANIYSVTPSGVSQKYYLDAGESDRSARERYIQTIIDEEISVHDVDEMTMNLGCITMHYVLNTPDILFFRYQKKDMMYNGFYYKNSDKFLEAAAKGKMPLANDFVNPQIPFIPMAADSKNNFYGYFESSNFEILREHTENKEILRIANEIDEYDNPVILVAKFKTE